MLSRIFQQLFASVGVVFRTIRAFFTRALTGTVARVKSATSLTRQAAGLAPAMMKTVAAAGKKPTRREDYIETKQLFISKSFLILVIGVVLALSVLFYLVAWPWLVSQFFTARMWYQDPDTADYSGKVILYYEKKKETVRFQGRLEEGLVQGEGRLFDEAGLLVYSGGYANGVYDGAGKLYTGGLLTYEGDFVSGLYEGQGALYSPEGELIYEGGFSGGLRSGEGTAYENGKKRYKGAFEDDLYNGEGTLYDDRGDVLYKGSFQDGLYHGEGTLFRGEGITVAAAFQEGEVLGDARCSANGRLYYEGGLVDLLPEGIGTLYGSDGKVLYTGPMKNGTIDGGALLSVAADDLREMLGGRGKETVGPKGFAITSDALGLALFCSFAREDAEPAAYYVYLYEPADALLAAPWQSAAALADALPADEDAPEEAAAGRATPSFPVAAPEALGGEAWCRAFRYEGYQLRLWSQKEGAEPLLAEWLLDGELPASGQSAAPQGSQGRLTALLKQLGLAQSGGTGGKADPNPYYGKADPQALLAAAGEESRTAVVTAALTYFERAERRAADEENLALCQSLLEAEEAQVSLGKGDALRLSQLEDAATRLEVEVMKHVVQMRKDARTIEDATGLSVQEFDVQALAVLFDVTQLDVAALGEEAVELAMEAALAAAEIGPGEIPDVPPAGEEPAPEENAGAETPDDESAGAEEPSQESEPPVTVQPVDRKAILQAVEDSVLALELAYQDVQLALREYETATQAAAQAEQDFATGAATDRERLEAQMTANQQRAALYTAAADFARQAAALNESTGGLLAAQVDWLPQVLGN